MSETRFDPGSDASGPFTDLPVDIGAAGRTTGADRVLRAAYAMPPILGHLVGGAAMLAGGGEPRSRMASALREHLEHARAAGLSPNQAFQQLMQSPEFVEGFVSDPDFGKSVVQAAQLARDPGADFARGLGQAQSAGFLDPRQAQGLRLRASAGDLAGAISAFAQNVAPDPMTLAQIATLEQGANHFDRRLSFDERKFVWEQRKAELEARLALEPKPTDTLQVSDRFRQEARPFITGLQAYERVIELASTRDEGGSVSDAAADGIVASFGRQIAPDIGRMDADKINQLAVTGAIPERIAGTLRRWALGERLTRKDIDDIVTASTDLAVLGAEGFDATAQAFVNTTGANFPRSGLSRDDLRKRIIPEIVKPETMDRLWSERAEKRRRNEVEAAASAQRQIQGPPRLSDLPDSDIRTAVEAAITALKAGEKVSAELIDALRAELKRRKM